MRLVFLKIISLIFITNIYADTLLVLDGRYSYCIRDNYYFNNDGSLHAKLSQNNIWYDVSNQYTLTSGYRYGNSKCRIQTYLRDMGMSYEHFNSLMGLMGVLFGFTYLFLIIYLVIEVAHKRI